MDLSTILLIALLLGTIWLFLFGLKKVLDAETYKTLTNKIVAYIVKAENDIYGYKKGNERLNEVVENITKSATKSERKLLQKTNVQALVSNVFSSVVMPIVFKKVGK